MKTRTSFNGVKDLTLEQIEDIVNSYQSEYPFHNFEIHVDEKNGELDLWLDDCDREVFVMTIIPTKDELKVIDTDGICGHRPPRHYNCPLGLGKYDWLFGRKTCNACRKCFEFKK